MIDYLTYDVYKNHYALKAQFQRENTLFIDEKTDLGGFEPSDFQVHRIAGGNNVGNIETMYRGKRNELRYDTTSERGKKYDTLASTSICLLSNPTPDLMFVPIPRRMAVVYNYNCFKKQLEDWTWYGVIARKEYDNVPFRPYDRRGFGIFCKNERDAMLCESVLIPPKGVFI